MTTTSNCLSRRLAVVVFVFVAASLSAAVASAQGVQTGTLRGTVVDQQNLPLPGVTVTISSPSLQGQRTGITESDGAYVFRALPAGTYQIDFELSAFDVQLDHGWIGQAMAGHELIQALDGNLRAAERQCVRRHRFGDNGGGADVGARAEFDRSHQRRVATDERALSDPGVVIS